MSLYQTFICSCNERELKRVIWGHIILFKLEFLDSVPSANLCTPAGEDRKRELHPNDKQMKIKTTNFTVYNSNLAAQNSSAVTLTISLFSDKCRVLYRPASDQTLEFDHFQIGKYVVYFYNFKLTE